MIRVWNNPRRTARLHTAARGLAILFMLSVSGAAWSAAQPDSLACEALVERTGLPEARYEEGTLWRISRDGLPDSYLFGTMHISDPAVMNFAPEIRSAYDAAQLFVMEVVLDPDAIARMQHSMFYHDGRQLTADLGPDLYAAVSELAPRHGIPPDLLALMRPWAVYMTLSVPPSRGTIPMDLALMLEAQKDGKEIVGLETVSEQTAVLGDLTLSDQVTLLKQTVCHYETLQEETAGMIEIYKNRDLAGLLAESMRYAVGDARIDREVFEALIWERNETMFKRLRPLLAENKSFIAVGALHLPGPRGLLSLFEENGYSVEAVY